MSLVKTTSKVVLAFSLLMTIPLLSAEGNICQSNEHGGVDECTPHNMLYVLFWNLSNFFDHHEGFVIGIATICLVLITAFLWDATRDLVISAETTAERQQRAYIGVESIMLDCPSVNIPNYRPARLPVGSPLTDFIILNIKNFGATPANKVYTWVNWHVVPFPQGLPVDFDYPDHEPVLPPGVERNIIETTLFPTETYSSKISMDDVNPLILSNTRRAFVYFYGKIVYTDITKTERITYFCFRHLSGRQPGQEFDRYRDHNYAT